MLLPKSKDKVAESKYQTLVNVEATVYKTKVKRNQATSEHLRVDAEAHQQEVYWLARHL